MKRAVIAAASAAALALSAGGADAAPVLASAIRDAAAAVSPVEQARTWCYNRYTGVFLHWGSCYRPVYRPSVPRVYCRNRWTGRFLHWGAC